MPLLLAVRDDLGPVVNARRVERLGVPICWLGEQEIHLELQKKSKSAETGRKKSARLPPD